MELRRVVDPGLARALIIPMPRPLSLALGALVGVTLLRLAVAANCPLSPDEAYYWVWSRHLQAGYLDHPAMTALWIRAGTWLAGDGPLGVRLFAPLSAALGSFALVSAGRDFATVQHQPNPVKAGLWAAVLFNATLALGAGSVIITPDTPLLFFWTLTLASLGRVLVTRRGAWWLFIGLFAGLALDSKYTAALTGAGLAGWLVATRHGRAWLRSPWPWLGAAVAAGAFAPTVWWNAQHGWASFLKQGGRTGAWHPTLRYLGELVGGQIGLATPLISVVFAFGGLVAWRARRQPPGAASLLLWTTALPAVVFIQHALGDRVQANWPVLLYPGLCLAGGLWCAVSASSRFRWLPSAAVGLGLALAGIVYLQSTIAPFTLRPKLDVTLARLAGWQGLADAVNRAVPVGMTIAADEYGLASELAHDLPADRQVLGAEPRWALFDLPHATDADRHPIALVRRLRAHDAPDPALWRLGAPIAVVVRCRRAGACADRYAIYIARAGASPVPIAVLPRPPS